MRLLGDGGLRVLTLGEGIYLDNDLRELSRQQPLAARAEHISRHLTDGARPFAPSARKRQLYGALDAGLATRPGGREEVDAGSDIWERFAENLAAVLQDCEDWWHGTYPRLTPKTGAEYLAFIHSRELAFDRIQRVNAGPPPVVGPQGRIEFSRSLAKRLASTYPTPEFRALTDLIDSTFTAVFTHRERAAGTYGAGLREVIISPVPLQTTIDETSNPVIVEVVPGIPLGLPPPGIEAMDAVIRVRNDAAGIALRRLVRDVGARDQTAAMYEAWSAVAELLTRELDQRPSLPKRRITIRSLATDVGGSVVAGAMVDGLVTGLVKVNDPIFLGTTIASQLLQIAGPISFAWLRHFNAKADMRARLEDALIYRTARVIVRPGPPGSAADGGDAGTPRGPSSLLLRGDPGA